MPQAEDFASLTRRARARLLKMHFEAKMGHLGGNLSCLDALLVLHARHLRPQDAFVLSKGHSAGALYIALWATGGLDEALLTTFHQDGTHLAGHPMAGWHSGIPFSTGSLGHGLSQAAGLALAARLQGQDRRVACLLSDGEWQEGSNWEALIFAAHHKLDNLCALVDLNGLQGFGRTAEVASLGDLQARLQGFDVDLQALDGHDHAKLEAALARPSDGRPRVLLLHTVKGKGVSFMQDRLEWHYLPMDAAQYAQALAEVGL